MKILLLMTTVVAAIALAGCHFSAQTHPRHDVVHVDSSHGCDDHCSHYSHEGRWYNHHGHKHGSGCGHGRHGGIWVVVR